MNKSPKTILLAALSPTLTAYCQEILSGINFKLTHVSTFETLLAQNMSKQRYHAILLEQSPSFDSLGFIESNKTITNTPIIIISTDHSEALEDRAHELGVRYYLPQSDLNLPVLRRILRFIPKAVPVQYQHDYVNALHSIIPDAIISTDMQGNITSWNQGAKRIYGWQAKEVMNQPLESFFQTDFLDYDPSDVVAEIQATSYWQGEVSQLCKNGTRIYTHISTAYITDPQGNPTGTIGLSHNITQRIENERRLKENEQRLKEQTVLFEHAYDAIIITNNNFQISAWNPAAEKLYGWTAEEVLGKSPPDLLNIEYITMTEAEVTKIFTETGRWQGEVMHTRRDGRKIRVQISGSMLRDQNGTLFGNLSIVRDVTERQAMLDQLGYQANILQQVSDAIIATDENYQITSWNRGAEKVYGWPAKDAIGQDITALLKTQHHHFKVETLRQRVKDEGVWSGELIHTHQNETPVYVHSAITRLDSKQYGIDGLVAVNRDISSQHEAEQNRLNVIRTQERMRILQDFVSAMTHDIFTPLTTAKTSIYLLQKTLDDPAKRERYVQKVDESLDKLQKLLNNVLAVSQFQNEHESELDKAPHSISQLIQEILLDQRAYKRNPHLSVDAPLDIPTTHIDRYQMKIAFQEVIMNALNYTPEAKPIRIKVERAKRNIHITIQDEGIGISPDQLPYVFDHFYRGDSARNTAYGGSGLGLTLAKQIIEAHQGTIGIKSVHEQGTIVVISLPIILG